MKQTFCSVFLFISVLSFLKELTSRHAVEKFGKFVLCDFTLASLLIKFHFKVFLVRSMVLYEVC